MVATEQSTNSTIHVARRWKRGDVGPDGRVFLNYATGYRNGEYWVSAERFELCNKRKAERDRKYYATNPEHFITRKNSYRSAHLGECREADKRWYQQNKVRHKQTCKNWMERNRERRRTYMRQWERDALKDPLFKLKKTIRKRLSNAIADGGFTKRSSTFQYVGCEWQFLKGYIEAKFKPGMSWENHGEWHIDHITPLASAKTDADVLRLSHYTNLQPLWAPENLSKGDKMPAQ